MNRQTMSSIVQSEAQDEGTAGVVDEAATALEDRGR